MPNPPKRLWLSNLSPFRWLESWLDRMNRRQREMLGQLELIQRQIAASRAQAAELRAEIERLQELTSELTTNPPLPLPTSAPATPVPVGRRCPRGHTAPASARFCPECGHVFPTRSGGG